MSADSRERRADVDRMFALVESMEERTRVTHVDSYDALNYNFDSGYDPFHDVLSSTPRAQDCWGSAFPAPSQSPAARKSSWYDRR